MIDLRPNVRGLTLLNPWAHLIAHGDKRVENRSWLPWAGVDQILIHAGKGWDDSAGQLLQVLGIDVDGVQPGVIVAVADISHVCDASRRSETMACSCGVWAVAGQCHWGLANVKVLANPVPCRGRQGLWPPGDEILDRVRLELEP